MRQCLLHLIRHGQTAWNAQKRLQGQIDIPLNEQGLAQAEQVAQEFEGYSLGGIYSSPLQRAHQTAQAINRSHQHSIQLHHALQESSYGSLDGIFIEEYHRRCKEKDPSFHQMTYKELLHFKLADDAESYFEVYQKVRPVLDEIVQKHLGEEVVIVTHGGLMRAVIAMLVDEPMKEIQISNIGCLTLSGDGKELKVHRYKRIKVERA